MVNWRNAFIGLAMAAAIVIIIVTCQLISCHHETRENHGPRNPEELKSKKVDYKEVGRQRNQCKPCETREPIEAKTKKESKMTKADIGIEDLERVYLQQKEENNSRETTDTETPIGEKVKRDIQINNMAQAMEGLVELGQKVLENGSDVSVLDD